MALLVRKAMERDLVLERMEYIGTLPKGLYVLSDPCYVLSNEAYDVILEKAEKVRGTYPHLPMLEYEGAKFFVHHTEYGDGTYPGNFDTSFGVDSGMLGCIPLSMCASEAMVRGAFSGSANYNLVFFRDDFDCGYDDGTIVMGEQMIFTSEDNRETLKLLLNL